MPGIGGAAILPGDGHYTVTFDRSPDYHNLHAGASYVKMIANMIVQNTPSIAFTHLTESWPDDTSNPSLPCCAYQVYGDDAITPELVHQLSKSRIPLLAVLSRDPKHCYYAAGIYYAYDAVSGVYTGRSLGRGDAFTYRPSPFAQWYRYNDDFVTMQTLVEFGGSALVIFYGQDSARRDCVPDTTKLAFSRDRGSLASGFKPTQHRVPIPDAPLYAAPAKEYSPPLEYMTLEAFLRHPQRVVDMTVDDPIDPPPHALEIC